MSFYACVRAYVDYIFVIIFSAKIYDSYILSISVTYDLRISTCAEKERERFLENPSPDLFPFTNHLPDLPTRLLQSVSPSYGNDARLRLSSAKLLLLFAHFPIFPIIETPIPYNSAYSIFYLLEKG